MGAIMRKIMAIVLSGVVLLSLFGCSLNQTPSTTYKENKEQTEETEETELQSIPHSEARIHRTESQVPTRETAEEPLYLAYAKLPESAGHTRGLINEKGEYVIVDQSESLELINISSNGLLSIIYDNASLYNYTYYDLFSAFPLQYYYYAGPFSYGLAPVAIASYNEVGTPYDVSYSYINESGEIVITSPSEYHAFRDATPFADNGLAIVKYQAPDKYEMSSIFIDTEGNFVFGEKTFIQALNFSNGFAAVKNTAADGTDLWGYIDETGEYVIDLQYAVAGPFSKNGYALVRDGADEHTGIIDMSGKWLTTIDDNIHIPFSYTPSNIYPPESYFADNGLAVCYSYGTDGEYSNDDLYGYVNESGAIVIECQFIHSYPFASNGLASACVYKDGLLLYGYIDNMGNFVIDPIFCDAGSFALSGKLAKDFSNPVPAETSAILTESIVIPTESSVIPEESIFIPEDIGDPVNTSEMYSCYAHMTSFDPNTGWAEFDYFLLLSGEEAIQWIMERDGLTYEEAYQYIYADENLDKYINGVYKNTNPQLRTIDLHNVSLKLVYYPIQDIIVLPEGSAQRGTGNEVPVDFITIMKAYYTDPAILTNFYYYITVDENGVPISVEQIFRS